MRRGWLQAMGTQRETRVPHRAAERKNRQRQCLPSTGYWPQWSLSATRLQEHMAPRDGGGIRALSQGQLEARPVTARSAGRKQACARAGRSSAQLLAETVRGQSVSDHAPTSPLLFLAGARSLCIGSFHDFSVLPSCWVPPKGRSPKTLPLRQKPSVETLCPFELC